MGSFQRTTAGMRFIVRCNMGVDLEKQLVENIEHKSCTSLIMSEISIIYSNCDMKAF